MNKYKFSLVYKILVYPVTVEAPSEEEAHEAFNEEISKKTFPTNEEISTLGDEFYSEWNVASIEASCLNCGEVPELIDEDYTVCPSGCYIAF